MYRQQHVILLWLLMSWAEVLLLMRVVV